MNLPPDPVGQTLLVLFVLFAVALLYLVPDKGAELERAEDEKTLMELQNSKKES